MKFILSDSVKAKMKKHSEDTLTITLKKKRSNCCTVFMPTAHLGKPQKHIEDYDVHQLDHYTIYLSKKAIVIEDTIRVEYSEMLTLKLFEVQGLDLIRHMW